MKLGAHWAQRAFSEAKALGFDFVWLNADTLDDPAYQQDIKDLTESGLSYVLTFGFTSEDRLLDHGGAFRHDVANCLRSLQYRGLIDRCLAIQLDDEFYARLYSSAGRWPAADWPLVSKLPPEYDAQGRPHWRSLVPIAAQVIGQRIADIKSIFGPLMPALGVGLAEPGGVDPPNAQGQAWWGCNFYLSPHYMPDIATVHRMYGLAAAKGLRLMPVLGMFAEADEAPASLETLAACYLPVLERYRERIDMVGVFLLNHPGHYDARHGAPGQDLLTLGEPYTEGVRWLSRYLHAG